MVGCRLGGLPLSLPPSLCRRNGGRLGGRTGVAKASYEGAPARPVPRSRFSVAIENEVKDLWRGRSSAIGAIRDFHRGPPRLLAREERVRCQSPASSSSAPAAAARPHGVGLCPAAGRCLSCGMGVASYAIRWSRGCPWLRPGPPIRPLSCSSRRCERCDKRGSAITNS